MGGVRHTWFSPELTYSLPSLVTSSKGFPSMRIFRRDPLLFYLIDCFLLDPSATDVCLPSPTTSRKSLSLYVGALGDLLSTENVMSNMRKPFTVYSSLPITIE